MTSYADIDNLIAALHPYIAICLFNWRLHPPHSLRPSKDIADVRSLTQAFATFFAFYPDCDVAAVAPHTSQSGKTSLTISLSPFVPHAFERNVELWFTNFTTLVTEFNAEAAAQQRDMFSPLEERFILHTYNICYPSMYQQIIECGFGDWNVFVKKPNSVAHTVNMKRTEEEERLRQVYADEHHAFSELVRRFADYVSRDTLGKDEDVLRFHKLCTTIREKMSDEGFMAYLNEYIYRGVIGPEPTYFNLPLAVCTLLTLSRNPNIALDDPRGWVILDPSTGARQFSAIMTEDLLAERFADSEQDINWKKVVQEFGKFRAFIDSRALTDEYRTMGYQWDADENELSTIGLATLHPEIILIQHLLAKRIGKGEAYIACSRTPCYASSMYALAVNRCRGTRFTMDIDDPHWCQLSGVEPWILPENTRSDVIAKMAEYLLEDLERLMKIRAQFLAEIPEHIPSGDGVYGWD